MPDLNRRLLDPVADLDLLVSWVHEERAVFWGMREHTREEIGEIYQWITDQEHLAAYLICDGDRPLCLLQTYDPFVDEIGEHYERRPGDLGVHFFMAPDSPLSTREVVGWAMAAVFADPAVQRLVVEPDVRNHRSVGLVIALGFDLGPIVDLPGKTARFAFLPRPVG